MAADKTMLFRVAELTMEVVFAGGEGVNGVGLIRSFLPFRTSGRGGDDSFLFRLTVDDTLKPRRDNRERVGTFDTGNGDTTVDRFPDGSYQYIIKDIAGRSCCLLQADKEFADCRCALNGDFDMRQYGLNNALILVFAFAGCFRQTLLIHASLVRHDGRGYAFTAKSGTGKSTQVSNWLRYIPGCDLMNDDNPVVRVIGGEVYIYGSPWSGKTPCYRDVKAPLGAVTKICRDTVNRVERMPPIHAFATLLTACSSMKWDSGIYNAICDTVTRVVEKIPVYTLHCLPDRESAIVCHDAIAKNTCEKQDAFEYFG